MNPLRILIACEESGTMRRAFAALGHDAWSCDLAPARDGSNRHIRGDVRDHLHDGWDFLMVAHPPCTVLCNSGVKHLYLGGRKENGRNPARWAALDQSYHEREISRAVEARGGMVLTFASPAGTWTLVVVAPQEPLMACMVASGTGYMTIAPGAMN